MKKALLATAALLSGVGVAYAQESGVTITGNARFGLEYVEGRASETQLDWRYRLNFDASKESDAGVRFGARLRIQSDDGETSPGAGPAYVFAEASGFRIEVGNANTAFDSAALMYNSEVGYGSNTNSEGNPRGDFFSYTGKDDFALAGRAGVYASYAVGDLNARLSFITPDQTTAAAVTEEISVSFDYSTGPFTVSLAAAQDGGGVAGNDLFFFGAEYAINDRTNVGLLFNDNGSAAIGNTITLYGNMSFGATSVQAYLASAENQPLPTDEDLAIGLGAKYDLGGAEIGGSIESLFNGNSRVKLGVGFSF